MPASKEKILNNYNKEEKEEKEKGEEIGWVKTRTIYLNLCQMGMIPQGKNQDQKE